MKLKLIQHEQHARRLCQIFVDPCLPLVKFLLISVCRVKFLSICVCRVKNFVDSCQKRWSVSTASKILSIHVKNVDPCPPRQILSICVKNVDPCLPRQILSIRVQNFDPCLPRQILSICVKNVDSCLPRQIFCRFVSAVRQKRRFVFAVSNFCRFLFAASNFCRFVSAARHKRRFVSAARQIFVDPCLQRVKFLSIRVNSASNFCRFVSSSGYCVFRTSKRRIVNELLKQFFVLPT